MGLDVQLSVINMERYHQLLEAQNRELLEIGLSRTFCNLLHRADVVDHEPELAQIAAIANVDLSPILRMDWYCDELDMEASLGGYETAAEKSEFVQQTLALNAKVVGNVDAVIHTLRDLIRALSQVEDLPAMLLKTDFDVLNNDRYFAAFAEDLGDGYLNNNFGQDLRNLLAQVEFAKAIGEETVYFKYG